MKTRKPIFLLTILTFLLASSCSTLSRLQELPYYPAYKHVMTNFLSSYSIDEIQYPQQFYMAKKPDGWHAMIVDVTDHSLVKDELYWERKTKKYHTSTFPAANPRQNPEKNSNIINEWRNNYFTSISPYWGYAGWDEDVINEYGEESSLPDSLLNALARAYCNYAKGLLGKKEDFLSEEKAFSLPAGQDALTGKQLAEYRKYEHKAIETYYRLWQQNPDFETFVADIYNVYSNEVMNSYLTLLYFQNQEEASKELKPGLYDAFYKDMAKRLLASCDENAILLVNGDSDTYPLLYLQEMEGYRTDVSVVNVSMLGSGRYVSHLFQAVSGREPINFTMSEEIYQDESKLIFYVVEKMPSADFKTLIRFVSSDDPRSKLKTESGNFDFIPTSTIEVEYNRESLSESYLDRGMDHSGQDNKVLIKLDKKYLYLNQFALLDILGSNEFQRPVYFAITVSNEEYLNLDEYLQCEGFAYKITPFKMASPNDGTGNINTAIQYKKLMETGLFHPKNASQKYYEGHKRMIRFYRNTYRRLAGALIDENRNDSALTVLDYCLSEFGSDKAAHEYFSLGLIEGYYRIGQMEAANSIANEILQSTKEKSEELLENAGPDDYDLRELTYTLSLLSELTSAYIPGTELDRAVSELLTNLI